MAPKIFISALLAFILATPPALAQVPGHLWSQRFGDSSEQSSISVAIDVTGSVVIAGYFFGTVNFGGGPLTSAGGQDILVAKFGPDGAHLWSARFGDTSNQRATCVAVDGSGNVFITGFLAGTADFGGGTLTSLGPNDVFVVKLDADGNHLWSKRYGNTGLDEGDAVATDASGNVVIVGSFSGTVNFGGGPLTGGGMFAVKLDADGNHLWSRRYLNAVGLSVVVDSSDNVVVSGLFSGSVNFGGGLLPSAGSSDIFVAKFDAGGTHLWSQRFGDAMDQDVCFVTVDNVGNVVITGDFFGTVDFGGGPLTAVGDYYNIFLGKFSPNGNHLWSHRLGGVSLQQSRSAAVDGSGNVLITGDFWDTVDFGGGPLTSEGSSDIFVAEYDAGGTHFWSQRFGGASTNEGWSVAADALGNVVVTGSFAGTVDFGGGPLTGAGNRDIFLAKLGEQAPNPVLITSFEATARDAAIEIRWSVWSDEALESFTLYRRENSMPLPVPIGRFEPGTRSYFDTSVKPEQRYHYELVIRTRDGGEIRSPVASATVHDLPAALGQNFPNPFNPSTTIEYSLNERSAVVLNIYDAAGTLVVGVDQGVQDAGTHLVHWDGRNAQGRAVGSGVYFYGLEGAKGVATKKMILLK